MQLMTCGIFITCRKCDPLVLS